MIESGTGTAADIGRPAAGKTGTTSNFTNAWFVGYTPTLSTAVWMGDADNESTPLRNIKGVPEVFGGTIPAETWRGFMIQALAGVPATDFSQPAPLRPLTAAISPAPAPVIGPGGQRSPASTPVGGPYRVSVACSEGGTSRHDDDDGSGAAVGHHDERSPHGHRHRHGRDADRHRQPTRTAGAAGRASCDGGVALTGLRGRPGRGVAGAAGGCREPSGCSDERRAVSWCAGRRAGPTVPHPGRTGRGHRPTAHRGRTTPRRWRS